MLDRPLIADGSIPEYSEHTKQVGLNIFVLAGDLLQRHCVHPIYSAQHLLRQVTREARASAISSLTIPPIDKLFRTVNG